jgi:hypothetical protein
MSKGLNTTIALGGAMLALIAVGTGASAQGAKWDLGAPDPMAITWPREEPAQPYRETVEEERNQPTNATGDAAPERKVRSRD